MTGYLIAYAAVTAILLHQFRQTLRPPPAWWEYCVFAVIWLPLAFWVLANGVYRTIRRRP